MRKLTDFDLAFKEDDERLVLEGRQILRRVLNEARWELEEIHKKAQIEGKVVRATGDPGSLEKLLLAAAKRELVATPVDTKKALEIGDKLRKGENVQLDHS